MNRTENSIRQTIKLFKIPVIVFNLIFFINLSTPQSSNYLHTSTSSLVQIFTLSRVLHYLVQVPRKCIQCYYVNTATSSLHLDCSDSSIIWHGKKSEEKKSPKLQITSVILGLTATWRVGTCEAGRRSYKLRPTLKFHWNRPRTEKSKYFKYRVEQKNSTSESSWSYFATVSQAQPASMF